MYMFIARQKKPGKEANVLCWSATASALLWPDSSQRGESVSPLVCQCVSISFLLEACMITCTSEVYLFTPYKCMYVTSIYMYSVLFLNYMYY